MTPTATPAVAPRETSDVLAPTGSLASGIGSRKPHELGWHDDCLCISDSYDVIIYVDERQADKFSMNEIKNRLKYDTSNFGQEYHAFHHRDPFDLIGYVFLPSPSPSPGQVSVPAAYMEAKQVTDVTRARRPTSLPKRQSSGGAMGKILQSATVNETLEQLDLGMKGPALNEQAWWRSHILSYPGEKLSYYGAENELGEVGHPYYHGQHLGQDQVIYLIDTKPDLTDKELVSMDAEALPDLPFRISPGIPSSHGTSVAGLMVGAKTGIVPRAKIVYPPDNQHLTSMHLFLPRLLQVVNHLEANKELQGHCVINMPWGFPKSDQSTTMREWGRVLGKLLVYLERRLKCVLVTLAGNFRAKWPDAKTQDYYPNLLQHEKKGLNMLISGATGRQGYLSLRSQGAASPTCLSNYGKLYTGYYCQPTHKSVPPGHDDPAHTRPAPMWTTTGTTRSTQALDGGLTSLPPLTNTYTPVTDCAGKVKPTTISNRSGGRMACVTSSYCSSYPAPTPTATATDMLCQINRDAKTIPAQTASTAGAAAATASAETGSPPKRKSASATNTARASPVAERSFCSVTGDAAAARTSHVPASGTALAPAAGTRGPPAAPAAARARPFLSP
ncbi:exo-beta-1,3-glucanase [Cordyceps fumosorosea ARSEF 2679]|uniref:Exo-beta-1,3-glucanase n=1 Tax=Cordyceps fumosorosea (strain ARSEF 2679) TaxID=1081104 RepID=A0A167BDY3_CORFA|nr:exo-beta-1,3-glucanase [Cordyceps fumosorosea ARSEF 2679]OAA39935.1 exo-beta-1,3-glucanase [Cordyceps fumosorosea ARSEF 2679]